MLRHAQSQQRDRHVAFLPQDTVSSGAFQDCVLFQWASGFALLLFWAKYHISWGDFAGAFYA
jgi:hypothetical protein